MGSFEEGVLITGLMRVIEEPSEDDRMIGPELMTEDEVKLAVKTVLEQKGYAVEVAWGHARGVDLEARKGDERLLIEAKGDAPTPQMQGNYFLNAIGELVQRMMDPNAEYGLAFPDVPRYRGLVERLPDHALDVLRLHAFLVGVQDNHYRVRWLAWDAPRT